MEKTIRFVTINDLSNSKDKLFSLIDIPDTSNIDVCLPAPFHIIDDELCLINNHLLETDTDHIFTQDSLSVCGIDQMFYDLVEVVVELHPKDKLNHLVNYCPYKRGTGRLNMTLYKVKKINFIKPIWKDELFEKFKEDFLQIRKDRYEKNELDDFFYLFNIPPFYRTTEVCNFFIIGGDTFTNIKFIPQKVKTLDMLITGVRHGNPVFAGDDRYLFESGIFDGFICPELIIEFLALQPMIQRIPSEYKKPEHIDFYVKKDPRLIYFLRYDESIAKDDHVCHEYYSYLTKIDEFAYDLDDVYHFV